MINLIGREHARVRRTLRTCNMLVSSLYRQG